MFRDRKIINVLSKYYYTLIPGFILRSKKFHKFLYSILIGRWFNVNFKSEYRRYSSKEWVKLYDLLFINRIREEDLTGKQKECVLANVLGPTVFEIGCGTGRIIEAVTKSNDSVKKIVGNDISPAVIRLLKNKFRKYHGVTFVLGDFLKINPKAKYNTVLCLHTLEHIVNPQKAADLMKIISKKRIIVIVPNEIDYPYPPNYHVSFFNKSNPVTDLFKHRKNTLKLIDNDYLLISDKK